MEKSIILKQSKSVTCGQHQTALFGGLSLFILVFPLAKYIWAYHVRANQVQEIFLVFLAIYFLLILGLEYRNKKIEINKVTVLALIFLALFGLISCFWNGNLSNTIYGDEFQGEGWITLVTYYVLFLAAAHLRDKKYRCWLMLFVCLELGFISLYGIMQFYHVPFMVHNVIKAAILPTRNQNFFAAFPVLLLGIVFGKLLYGEGSKENERILGKNNIVWHVLLVLGYGAAIGSDSLVAYMGLIMQFLLMLFLECFRKQKRFKVIFLFILEFLLVFFIFDCFSGGQAKEEVFTLSAQIQKEGTVFGDSVGTGRMKIWKETLRMIPKNWAFGCGIENYLVDVGTIETPAIFSNAHNEYLQIWAEQGTFAVVSYLVFLFSLFIPGLLQFIRREWFDSDIVSKAAMFAFFGYIAQAFGNIRVLQVAPYFWICCGLLYVRRQCKGKEDTEEQETE